LDIFYMHWLVEFGYEPSPIKQRFLRETSTESTP
jgi:hypothetical protein